MSDEEYRKTTIDRIIPELSKLTSHELHNVLQYMFNPSEFDVIDLYIYSKIDTYKLKELKEKYPEEFV